LPNASSTAALRVKGCDGNSCAWRRMGCRNETAQQDRIRTRRVFLNELPYCWPLIVSLLCAPSSDAQAFLSCSGNERSVFEQRLRHDGRLSILDVHLHPSFLQVTLRHDNVMPRCEVKAQGAVTEGMLCVRDQLPIDAIDSDWTTIVARHIVVIHDIAF